MQTTGKEQLEPRSVGMVSPGWPPEALANGIVSYVATLARALETQQVHCHVLTSRPMADAVEPFVHVIRPDVSSLRSKLMWRISPRSWENRSFSHALLEQVRKLQTEHDLELIEIEESYGWARYLWGHCPVPVIVRLHGPWFLNGVANGVVQDGAFKQRDRWERSGLLCADGITAPSRHVLEETRQHFGLALPDAQVIPNPVEPVGIPDRWNLQECDQNRIAFVGRFDRHKGGDTILEAFSRVVQACPNAKLDFIGPDRGFLDDAGRLWKFEEYFQQHLSDAARSNVTYHGFLPGAAAAKVRKRALVTMAPSRYETFGIATAEAMMAGCPLVVCGAGALTELIQDSQNGLVASVGSATDLADKVVSLLKDPQGAKRLGEQAALDAAQRYLPHVVARQTVDYYRRVLSRAPGRAIHSTSKPSPERRASVSA
jgi:glycosyltransferase involved in cell wall biosynthesis